MAYSYEFPRGLSRTKKILEQIKRNNELVIEIDEMILVLGSGNKKFNGAITLDQERAFNPDIVCKLGVDVIPLDADSVRLAIAIHILERIGSLGDTERWFHFWEEIYRVMKPDAILKFESPKWNSVWAFACPSNCRPISAECFAYLNQDNYSNDSGISPFKIRCDFKLIEIHNVNQDFFGGTLQAHKPLKPWWFSSEKE